MPKEDVTTTLPEPDVPPDTSAEKLACCRRAKAHLCLAVADLEEQFGSDVALIVTAGALRSASEVERLAQKVQREAAE